MNTARFCFQINWKITLCSAVLLPVLLCLGAWQLDRAAQKQTILQDWQEQQALPPTEFDAEHALLLASHGTTFRRVWVEGLVDNEKYWLIENKPMYGRIGAYVIVAATPIGWEPDQPKLLVNLGWVELPSRRELNPTINLPTQVLRLSGILSAVHHSPLIDEANNPNTGWPHKMLEVDVDEMEQQLGHTLFPFILKIDPDSPAAFDVHWKAVNMTSSKHKGYAVQWFAMAATLFILWLLTNSNVVALVRAKSASS